MKKAIGIDIGGTKISIVLADLTGHIIVKKVLATKTGSRARESISEIISAVNAIFQMKKIPVDTVKGIGVCIPGPVGKDPSIIRNAPNLPGWNGIKICAILQREFKIPVISNNDANAACIAEKVFGHGQDVDDFLYITISTGVGAGLIMNNRLIMGASNSAGELGHCMVEPHGPVCNCGKTGCLEAISSGSAIQRCALDLRDNTRCRHNYADEYSYQRFRQVPEYSRFNLRRRTRLFDRTGDHDGSLSAKHIAECARGGDMTATYIYFRAGYYFGTGLSYILQLINPQMIALGGSVTKSGNLYSKPMRLALQEYAWKSTRQRCRIVKAKLGDKVGDYGAIAMVIKQL